MVYQFKQEKKLIEENEQLFRQMFANSSIGVYQGMVVGQGTTRTDIIRQANLVVGRKPILIGTIDEILSPTTKEISSPFLDN